MRPRSMYPSHRSSVITSGMARINACLTSSADAPVSSHWRRASWSNACGGVRILQSMSSTTTWSMASGKSAAARNAIRDPIECPTSVNVVRVASPLEVLAGARDDVGGECGGGECILVADRGAPVPAEVQREQRRRTI